MTTIEAGIATRITRYFQAADVLSDPSALGEYEIDGMRPAAAVRVRSAEEVAEFVRFAATEKLTVIPSGTRTQLSIGRIPERYDFALNLSRMNRVLAYEPRDLTLGVEPGVKVSTIVRVLEAENQFLPLDPPFAATATIGGVIAADSVSPLRQRFGGPRDFVLGMEFVTGYGALSKSGGRVVKNVTGYDLHKPLIGSLGTLAVITRINFKTFPLPPSRATFLVTTQAFEQVKSFFIAIAHSPLEPITVAAASGSGTSAEILHRFGDALFRAGQWSIVIVAAGSDEVVARHRRDISLLVSRIEGAEFMELDGTQQPQFFEVVREFPRVAQESAESAVIFRIGAPPSNMREVVERISTAAERAETPSAILVHASGIIYFALLPTAGQSHDSIGKTAAEIFTHVAAAGANARIEFASTATKRQINVWGPRRDDFELMARVKRTFDPGNILSPGRFVEGV